MRRFETTAPTPKETPSGSRPTPRKSAPEDKREDPPVITDYASI